MAFDAYKYAKTFEKLACKIIEQEISDKILVSGVTKQTRDGGIDAIIHTNNNFVTIEAKLRKVSKSIGIQDIASSVIFYLLRLNDKHYIVTNVYLAKDTVDVLNKLNQTKNCEIHYIDGDSTIKRLKELMKSLNKDEKELTQILIKEFSQEKKKSKAREHKETTCSRFLLLKSQQKLRDSIYGELVNGKKCVVLSGKLGVGKSTVVNAVIEKLNQKYTAICIDGQQYNTIESFMYQLSNLRLGIDMNALISEYIILSEELKMRKDTLNLEQTNNFNVITQILQKERYSDSIKFLAQKYIDNLIDDFNLNNVCIIIDNYSAVSSELDDFISAYILHSTKKLHFLVVIDSDYGNHTNLDLEKIMQLPINTMSFTEIHINELTSEETSGFIKSICPNLSQFNKDDLYRYFGGNMLLIKMALEEMKASNNYNSSLLRPLSCEKIYEYNLKYLLKKDTIYIKAFFISWIMNGRLPLNYLHIIGIYGLNSDLLQNTGFFSENISGLTLYNTCAYNVISKYFIKYSDQLYHRISDFIGLINIEELSVMARIRVGFFAKSRDFVCLSNEALPIFENKLEHNNIMETRALLYFFAHGYSADELSQIEASANLVYELIDYDIHNIGFIPNISELRQHRTTPCKF